MLNVEKWAQNKHPLVAILATQIAAFAREIPEILRYQKKHRLSAHTFAVPHLPSWHALYRSHRRYLAPIMEMLSKGSPFAQQSILFGSALLDLSRNPDQLKGQIITPDTVQEAKQYMENFLHLSFADIQDSFDDIPLAPETRAIVQDYKDRNETELAFLFLVAFPCWFHYKECPIRLYRKARLGDVTAIHKLLHLDPFMLHDPSIGREIQKVRIHGKQTVYESLLNAPLKPIKLKMTSRTLKDSLAGLISQLADALNQPLTSTDIRDLFDAVAQDAEKQDIDTSLPDSQEAYSKVIQRNRSNWTPLLQPGQKNLK